MQPPPRGNESRAKFIARLVTVIVIVVSLTAAFFILASGHGLDPHVHTPAVTYHVTNVTGGVRITIASISNNEFLWDYVGVQLSDGQDSVTWSIKTSDLDGGHLVFAPYPDKTLGTLSVIMNVTDLVGNGEVNGGDFLTLTAKPSFSPVTVYVLRVVCEPNNERMGPPVAFPG